MNRYSNKFALWRLLNYKCGKHTINLPTAYYPRIYNPFNFGFVFFISASSRLNIPCFLSTIEYLFAHCDYFRFLSIIIFSFPLDCRILCFRLRLTCFGILDLYVFNFDFYIFDFEFEIFDFEFEIFDFD